MADEGPHQDEIHFDASALGMGGNPVPPATVPSVTPGAQIGFAFNPAIGPNGRDYFVSISVLLGVASFTFGVPLDGVDGWLKNFSQQVKDCATSARNHKLGLTVATPDMLRQNGRK